MLGLLSLCLPIFAVVALGFLATRRRMVSPVVVDAIGLFSFNVALPALLLRLMAAQPFAQSFEPAYFRGYLGACLVAFAATMLVAWWRRHGRQAAAAFGAAAAMGNVGYLAPPLLLPMLGPRAAGPVAMAIIAEVAVIIALGSVLMARSGGTSGAGLRAAWDAMRGLARNPVLLSIGGGVLVAAAGWSFPDPVERFLGFLGGAAGPTALFALGGTLARLSVSRDLLGIAAGTMLVKLVAYPLLVWLVLGMWLQLNGVWVTAGVLLAAMPTATNAFLLAQRHDAGADAVSAAVLLSTVVAAVTFPITAWLLDAPLTPPT